MSGKVWADGGSPAELATREHATRSRSSESLLSDEMFDRLEALERLAKHKRHSLLELAISWLLSQPALATVICGARKAEQYTAGQSGCPGHLKRGGPDRR